MEEVVRAVGFRRFGGPEVIEELELPVRRPGPGEVRVTVRAAGLNPTDLKVPGGALDGVVPHRFPVVLGWDLAGVVDATGEGTGWAPGEEVVGFVRSTPIATGALAESAVVPAGVLARAPAGVEPVRAAALPLAGLMADQLVEALGGRAGGAVLVLGAGGGVGVFVTQLLTRRGATVVGVDAADRHARLREHGAAVALDRDRPLAGELAGVLPAGRVDAVVDLVGGPALAAAGAVLAPGGAVVSSVQPPQAVLGPGAGGSFVVVEPDGRRLDRLARDVEAGRLRIPPVDVVPFADAVPAVRGLGRPGHGWKTVVAVR
ncbi:NADP-dependent oxidoreductase [Geodermatophilus sp. DSM 44513]|uniref:NADP-dependent oxidoreductase n=1 Tax=Geodermatophilus sp. DSM 44513 TaxID=1528104 RepID=UPI0028F74EDA|nr:NADP-dependent oxidoreductase [Geodermatophilus sp. DSM 44513]WNV73954.1 NADP-dependent oxidoreductase [Geodermatophilus sp. DSM 44513]